MVVQQQIEVLPAGAKFKIMDMHKCVMDGKVSQYDKSLLFDTPKKAEEYEKVWSRYHVTLIDFITEYVVSDLIIETHNFNATCECDVSVTWIINVR